MKLLQEFREFALRGNVVDLAVGVIIGGAFGKIVNSLVADVLMPPIGYLIGGIRFDELSYELPALTIKVPDPGQGGALVDKTLEPVAIHYGKFVQTSFDFLIIAICIFFFVKAMNRLTKRAVEKKVVLTTQEQLLAEIRDLLKQRA